MIGKSDGIFSHLQRLIVLLLVQGWTLTAAAQSETTATSAPSEVDLSEVDPSKQPIESPIAASAIDLEGLTKQQSVKTYGVHFHSRPWEDRPGDHHDWLRTTSGEWLQGEMKNMREDSITFDSDEFDLQTLDWEDVAELHLPQPFEYVRKDKSLASGPGDMVGTTVVVHTAAGDVILNRADLMSLTQAHQREINHWYYKLSLGATLRRGNTQSADYSAFSRLRREDAFNRATLEYNGTYGLVKDAVNTNKHRGDLTWNLFISPTIYLTPVWGMAMYDEFQNIKFRGAAASGAGIHVIDTQSVTLDFDMGLGYVNTRYISVEAGNGGKYRDGALLVPTLTFEWDITPDIDLDLSWQSSLVVTNIADSFHHGTARLSVEITDVFDLEFSAIYDRQESPVPDSNGKTPLRNDLGTTLSASLEFD